MSDDIPVRTSLRNAASSPTSDAAIRALRQKAWHVQGVAHLVPAEINDDWLRQIIINEANRQYGKPMKAAKGARR